MSGKNSEGYQHVLSFLFNQKNAKIPAKSALSQFRKRISFRFFRDYFYKLNLQLDAHSKTFRGYKIYAIDGFETLLPRSKNILDAGYSGRATGLYQETHYPKMYISHCYDVINQYSKSIAYSNENQEIKLACEIIPKLENKSITLYDRAYPSRKIIRAHRDAKSFFIARASKSSFKTAVELLNLEFNTRTFEIEGVELRAIKIPNSKTNEDSIYITNLPKYWAEPELLRSLYIKRWEVENSFREWVVTLRLEQWHSKTINGILQELYAGLWLLNFSRLQMLLVDDKKESINKEEIVEKTYFKPNFKLILDTVIGELKSIILSKAKEITVKILKLTKYSTAMRKRHSRSYPRQIKRPGNRYPFNNQHLDPYLWARP